MEKITELQINEKGNVIRRESCNLEFKENFYQHVESYIRTVCAFANNKGGILLFGVKDKPRKPIGLTDDKLESFQNYDTKDLTTRLQNFLSINVEFDLYHFSQDVNQSKVSFGVLQIAESIQKPVVCLKTHDKYGAKLREGAIYYRYNGKSEEIKAADLIKLIQQEKEKEQKKWMDCIQKIANIGVENVGFINYGAGEMHAGGRKIIIDKSILDKIKFIKEGHFVEKDGAPALILKGEITDNMQILKTDKSKDYAFEGQKAFINEIKKRGFEDKIEIKNGKLYALTYIFTKFKKEKDVEKNEEYFWSCGTSVKIKKYSMKCVEDFIKFLKNEKK